MSEGRRLAAALASAESSLSGGVASLDQQAEFAGLLAALGRTEEAKARYLEILAQDPSHFATLNNFGVLLQETRYRSAARTVFAEAVRLHPDEPLGHVNLANLLMYGEEEALARSHYETALRLDPANIHAHQRLSELLRQTGELEAARRHRRLGFGPEPIGVLTHLGDGPPVRLLVLTSTPAGDLPWPMLVERELFEVTTLVAEFRDLDAPLPPHDLIFNAIGDADLSAVDLRAAAAIVQASAVPVVNDPRKALVTGRKANADRLRGLPGVIAPRMAEAPREVLLGAGGAGWLAAEGLGFPLLLRSPGFHMGRHFVRVETAQALAGAVASLAGETVVAIEALDARGADGHARKYRVMMIDGRLYPVHLAISNDWKVHYATSAMSANAAFQTEEARFLEHMPEVLGDAGMAALRAIQAALGLDYAGIDFGLSPRSGLLLFEANAVMKIVPPDASPEWDYRRPAIERATAAARRMLTERGRAAAGLSAP